MQIMQYIKDKGDKGTGAMNILADVDSDIQRFFLQNDVGADDPSGEKRRDCRRPLPGLGYSF
jgi:hypothetical protein